MKTTFIAVAIAIVAVVAMPPAAAQAFTCTPGAIHAKAQYVLDMWKWLESSASDDAAASVYQAKLTKVWDGSGDCSGDEDMSKFSGRTQVELVQIHFYGDMMTVPFAIGSKDYKTARAHMDDWLDADALIRKNKNGFTDQIVADDARERDEMMKFDARLTKLGYPSLRG